MLDKSSKLIFEDKESYRFNLSKHQRHMVSSLILNIIKNAKMLTNEVLYPAVSLYIVHLYDKHPSRLESVSVSLQDTSKP